MFPKEARLIFFSFADKEDSTKLATKLTHPDIPGIYFIIPHYMMRRAQSKYHKQHNAESFYYGLENSSENQEKPEIYFKSLIDNNKKSGYEYDSFDNKDSEEPEFIPYERHNGKHKSIKHGHHHHFHLGHHNSENEYFKNMEDDLLTSGLKPSQRRHREVPEKQKQTEDELRIKRQNVSIQKCCENPKQDQCDSFLCG